MEPGEDLIGVFAGAARMTREHDARRRGAAPAAIIAGHRPRVAGVRPSSAGVVVSSRQRRVLPILKVFAMRSATRAIGAPVRAIPSASTDRSMGTPCRAMTRDCRCKGL